MGEARYPILSPPLQSASKGTNGPDSCKGRSKMEDAKESFFGAIGSNFALGGAFSANYLLTLAIQ
jgi:hypothetical protein